ncbi:MAG: Lrp/AsnC family transcriptional regulator [Oscillospiraceae bacterium]|jgi:DNA-binding Lrp family transcriptional regulator|nr:Lrp/AsnC family transcriptional regulator [Oscillospiraceae bacterium]
MKRVLKLLENDASLGAGQIALLLGVGEADVERDIAAARREGILLGSRSVINWEKAGGDYVTAMIEVRVTPQRGEGFDRVAERIYQFDEVESLYLMSGGYDLQAVVIGKSLKDVARFVAEKLSTLEQVTGTCTHFLLKKYKEGGVVYARPDDAQERVAYL